MTFQYPIKQLVLSHSSRSVLGACDRKFEFTKMFGDPPKEEKEEMFIADVGKALHVGVQEYLISKDINKAIFAFMLAFPYDSEYSEPKNQSRCLEASFVTLMEGLNSSIFDQFELVYIKTRFGDTRPAIEVPFAIEITNSPLPIPVWFVGFIDAIFYDRYNNRYVVNDIKSTRINVNDMSVRYEYDEQTVPYGIILEHILGQKIDEFEVSYLSMYIDIAEPKAKIYRFNKRQQHIEDWYRGLCVDIKKVSNFYNAKWFPRSTSGFSCFSFNKACWFAEYCGYRDPEVVQRMLNTELREGLFHSDIEAWVVAQLPYLETF